MANPTDHLLHDDDEGKKADGAGKFREFDCPECSANNPMDDGFALNDEIRCHYCGEEFQVRDRGDGRFKLRRL